jgi:hypothetical protein
MATKKRTKSTNRKPVNFVPIAAFVTPTQKSELKALSAKTRIPQQALLREALDDLFAKHAK